MHYTIIFAFVLLSALSFFNAAQADEGYYYSPPHCGFQVTFPDKPYKNTKCEGQHQEVCYEQASYTQFFEGGQTLNLKVICSKSDEITYKEYNPTVMRMTLRAMSDQNIIKTYEVNAKEYKFYKHASMIGEGLRGKDDTLYIAQLWLDDHSTFSIEAELTGDASETGDKLLSDVLHSVSIREDTEDNAKSDEVTDKAKNQDADADSTDSVEASEE